MSENEEYSVVESPLCQPFVLDGKTVQIDIYKGDNGGWLIEIVDEFDNSMLWDDEFTTDQEALDEAINAIKRDGISAFIDKQYPSIY